MMKICLEMKNDNGVLAVFVADGEWNAFDLTHQKVVERFEPTQFHKIQLLYRDGGMWTFPTGYRGSEDDDEERRLISAIKDLRNEIMELRVCMNRARLRGGTLD
jgi:hypothetical protein